MPRQPLIPLIACALALALAGCRAPASPGARPPEPSGAQPRWQTIGHTREHRPLQAATFGAAAPRLYIIGAIHGNEPEGLPVIAQLERRLRARPAPATIRILRDMNPDGTAAARRTNIAGVDLNRNWPAANFRPATRRGKTPLSEPEAAAAHADMLAFAPDIIIVLHSISSGPFVNFDGPGATLAATFATAAAERDRRWRIIADMGYSTPGSMGSYWGLDRRVPILTIEMARGDGSAAAVMAAVAGIEAILTSGFQPMADGGAPRPRSPIVMPVAHNGDATGEAR